MLSKHRIGVSLAMLLLGSTVVQAGMDVFSVNFYRDGWPFDSTIPDSEVVNVDETKPA